MEVAYWVEPDADAATQGGSVRRTGLLESAGLDKRVVRYARGGVIFSQGDACDSVMYLREGEIRLSVLSHTGKEAIVATLGAGNFLGEGALAGHPVRLETARATMPSTVLVVPRQKMIDLLHSEHSLSDRFIAHMLIRNARLEADLVDQLFNSSEKRLARTLLLLGGTARGTSRGACCPPFRRKRSPK